MRPPFLNVSLYLGKIQGHELPDEPFVRVQFECNEYSAPEHSGAAPVLSWTLAFILEE